MYLISHKIEPKVHINNTNEAIKPTVDSENENDALPFLDCLIKRNTDSTLDTTMYGERKNTGRFLNFHACHSSVKKQGPFPKSERIMLNNRPS